MADVNIDIKVDTSEFDSSMKKVKNTLTSTQSAADNTKPSIANLGKSMDNVGDIAGETSSAMGALAGGIGLISPEAETAVRTLGDLAGGVEGVSKVSSVLGSVGITMTSVGVAAGVLAPIVIAGGVLWKTYAIEAESARKQTELLSTALDGQREAISGVADMGEDLEEQLEDRLNGTTQAAKLEKARNDQIRANVQALKDEAAEVLKSSMAIAKSETEKVQAKQNYNATIAQANKDLERQLELSENIRFADEAEANAAGLAADRAREKAEAQRAAAEKSAKEAADAIEADRKRAQAALDLAAAESEARQIIKANNSDLLSEKELLLQAYQEEMDKLDDLEKKAGDNAEALDQIGKARLANEERLRRDLENLDEDAAKKAASVQDQALKIVQSYNSDLLSEKDSLIQAYQEEMDKLDDLEAKAGDNAEALNAIEKARVANAKRLERELTKLSDEEAKKRAQNSKESAQNVAQSAVDLAQAITDAAEAGGAAQKDIAIANKAIAIAQATINTALAISQALGAAPPPVNFVLAGLAAAAGAATVATIAATPIKHMGGVIAPDEANIRAQKGEGILTRQTVNRIGPEGVSQLNAGGNLGTNITVVEMGHQVIGKSLRRAQKRDGNPLRDLARKTRGR